MKQENCKICSILKYDENGKRQCDCKKSHYEMSSKCFVCGKEFNNHWKHYLVHGNCCRSCSVRAGRVVSNKKQKVNN